MIQRRRTTAFVAAIATAAVAASAVACGDDGEPETQASPAPPATVTATPTVSARVEPPFLMVGPLDPTQALSGDYLAGSGFVLDVRIGQVYVITADRSRFKEGDSFGPIAWLDDETLLIQVVSDGQSRLFRAGMDGSVELVTGVVAPTPASPRRSVSADGAWVAEMTPTADSFDLLVGGSDSEPQFRVTQAINPVWSPAGERLAFIGNRCSGFDVFLFNPATQELQNLTATLEPVVLSVSWRPDGAALAANVIPFGEDRRILGLIDANTGAMTPLIDVPITGELSPSLWSPDGNRLLFGYLGGRGICDTLPGTPESGTELEIIGG